MEVAPYNPAVTPPLSKERLPRNFDRPNGKDYLSSDLLDYHPMQSRHYYDSGLASTPKPSSISGAKTETSSIDASARTSPSRDSDLSELSISNASDMETEWVEQNEPGVYITIRTLPGGTRELRRVRFRNGRLSLHFPSHHGSLNSLPPSCPIRRRTRRRCRRLLPLTT